MRCVLLDAWQLRWQRARHRQADRKSLCDKVGVLDKFISLVFLHSLYRRHRVNDMADIVSLKVSLEQTAWVLGHHFKSRCGFLNLNVSLGRLRRVGNPRQPGH